MPAPDLALAQRIATRAMGSTSRQRGIVLIALLVLLGTAALYPFLGHLDASEWRKARDRRTESALAEAKEALIGRAATDGSHPGSLPCPDLVTNLPGNNVPGDGYADLFAGSQCPSYVGWLPWRTLDLPETRDGSHEKLWYALSPSLRDHTQPINTATPADLRLDDALQIAAIVFAPGPPLPGQAARPSLNVADYLDGTNADGDKRYGAGPVSAEFNDRVLAITHAELFSPVHRRVLRELRGSGDGGGLMKFRNQFNVFPWADADGNGDEDEPEQNGRIPSAALTLAPWILPNGWLPLVNYRVEIPRTAMAVEIDGVSLPCPSPACP